MDYLSFSGGQIFPFGGLTATLEFDRDFNISSYLTYNISFAKAPNSMDVITSANSKLSNTGTMYVQATDESGQPLEGIGLNANGLEKEIYTDENGVAVLTDLQTYEKTVLNVDTETLLDIALQPVYDEKKLVLRPGTIRTVSIPFTHRGAVEGKIENIDDTRMFGYQIIALDADNKEIASTFADIEGFFILDAVPYGTYKIVISKDGNQLAELQDVKVDDVSIYLPDEIKLDRKALDFFAEKDSADELQFVEEQHDLGYNNVDYRNRDLPIDIPQAVSEPQPHMPKIQIEEIEKDIFVQTEAPVFQSVASVQSFDRYTTVQDIEKGIFAVATQNSSVSYILHDLEYNVALQDVLEKE